MGVTMNSNILIEVVNPDVLKHTIVESKGEQKEVFIEGPFAEADVINGNKRIYPLPVLEKAMNKFIQEKVNTKRAVGELDHPSTLEINLERVSHLIVEIKQEKNIFYGKAKLLDTPFGKIAKTLVSEGVKFGVSTRGYGTLKEGVVQNDYVLKTIDIVADPSAPSAFVEGIVESKMDWLIEENIIRPKTAEEVKDIMDNFKSKYSMRDIREATISIFTKIMKEIKNDKI